MPVTPSSPTHEASHYRPPPLGPVLLVNFIGTMGFSIVLPFLVFLVTRFGGNAVVYGLVGATYPALQFFGAPVLGRWSDRFGRRKVLFLSQAGTLISWLIFAGALFLPVTPLLGLSLPFFGEFQLTLPLLVLIFARALDGLTGGNISVANAYVADLSNDENRSHNFGSMGVASNLGLVLGPGLASLLGTLPSGETWTVLTAALISLFATLVIVFILPESKPCIDPWRGRSHKAVRSMGAEPRDCMQAAKTRNSQHKVWAEPSIRGMLLLYFVIMLAFNLFYTAFPVRAATDLDWSVGDTGIFFVVLSSLMVLVQGPLLSALSQRIREIHLIISGCLLLGTNFLLMRSDSTPLIYLAASLFALGNGIMWPSLLSLLAKVAGDELQGEVQGTAGSAGSLASVIGLLLGGIAYDAVGEATFLLSAVLAVGAALLSFALRTKLP